MTRIILSDEHTVPLPPSTINVAGIQNLTEWEDADWHIEQFFTEDNLFTTQISPTGDVMFEISNIGDAEQFDRIFIANSGSNIIVERFSENPNENEKPKSHSTEIDFNLNSKPETIEAINDLIRRWMFSIVYDLRMKDDWGKTDRTKNMEASRITLNSSEAQVARAYQNSLASSFKIFVTQLLAENASKNNDYFN